MSGPGGHRVLVTGANGLVGMAVRAVHAEYLGKEFVFSSSTDCDLTRPNDSKRHVASCAPEAIIHLAAVRGGIHFSLERPATLLRDNVLMQLNILEAARACDVRKVVLCLSIGMYPADAPQPVAETEIHSGLPHPSRYSYAFAKRLIEPCVRAYRQEYGLGVIGLVPNGILGEHDDFRQGTSTFIAALIRRFYENRNGDTPITVWGDGSPVRQLTYSKDIARAILWCLDRYDDDRILNIGSPEEHSIQDIAHMIGDLLGVRPSRVVFDPTRPNGQPRQSTDNSRFAEMSGFTYTPLRSALERTLTWFEHEYEHNRSRLLL